MGLTNAHLELIVTAIRDGCSPQRVLMLGRQSLDADAEFVRAELRKLDVRLDSDQVHGLYSASGGFAEPLFVSMGAEVVESVDVSPFEGATRILDLGETGAGGAFEGRYSLVVDGGTMEHVFDAAAALRNCARMLAPGGGYVGVLPCNNFAGHGLYQFSPAFFRAYFDAEGTLEERFLGLLEDRPSAHWHYVRHPSDQRQRIQLSNILPTYVGVYARRTGRTAAIPRPAFQSDYVALWEGKKDGMAERLSMTERSKRWVLGRVSRSRVWELRRMRAALRSGTPLVLFKLGAVLSDLTGQCWKRAYFVRGDRVGKGVILPRGE